MPFWQAWLLFGVVFLLADLLRQLGPGSSTIYAVKQRGWLIGFLWALAIIIGSLALFVLLIVTPSSVIKKLPNFGPSS